MNPFKFLYRVLRYLALEIWKALILLLISLLTIPNIRMFRKKNIMDFINLDLWKLSKRGL